MDRGNAPTLTVGRKAVAVAGTAVQVGNVQIPDGFKATVKAESSNIGLIEVGGTAAEAQGATAYLLAANESIEVKTINLNVVWIDATVSTDGVEYIVEQDS